MLADLAARAAAATDPKYRTRSGQMVKMWRRGSGKDFALGNRVNGDAGTVLGAVAVLRKALGCYPNPEVRRQLDLVQRAAERLAELGRRLRGGVG